MARCGRDSVSARTAAMGDRPVILTPREVAMITTTSPATAGDILASDLREARQALQEARANVLAKDTPQNRRLAENARQVVDALLDELLSIRP